jgi:hypothetical protein
MMLPLLENHFNVGSGASAPRWIRGQRPVIYLKAAFSLTIGQGVVLAVRLGFQALRILSQFKSGPKTERGGLTMEKNLPRRSDEHHHAEIRKWWTQHHYRYPHRRTTVSPHPRTKLSFGFAFRSSDFAQEPEAEADKRFAGAAAGPASHLSGGLSHREGRTL